MIWSLFRGFFSAIELQLELQILSYFVIVLFLVCLVILQKLFPFFFAFSLFVLNRYNFVVGH